MNIADLTIKYKTATLVLLFIIIIGGIITYFNLGRLEDPTFTIKKAVIYTSYPGATPSEVEEEVTDVIETEIQRLEQLKWVYSISEEGKSIIYAEIKDNYTYNDLPQIWDELRRKVTDAQKKLPPGAGPSSVKDDYGDVYGIFLAITGKGYTYKELKDISDDIKKELLQIKDVAKIEIIGIQQEVVYVEFLPDELAQLGIPQEKIYQTIEEQNAIIAKGKVEVGVEYLRIDPTGAFSDIDKIGDTIINGDNPDKLIYLKDLAKIKRDYIDPPEFLVRYNGKPALAMGISTVKGGNVIKLGDAIKKKIVSLKGTLPIGIEADIISYESDTVKDAVNGFITNLLEALIIVIGLLFIFMGFASGLLIGIVLFATVMATFIAMMIFNIDFQSVSIGALIIALGMLVDNAIVVTEGIQVKIKTGMNKFKAAAKTVTETNKCLYGSTSIAILAFAAIGLSNDSTGEYCRSLFYVVGISLGLSYLFGVTITPLLCVTFMKQNSKMVKNPYNNIFFIKYRNLLTKALRHRRFTIYIMIIFFLTALLGFSFVSRSFFPDSTRPQFLVDYWMPQGTHINHTSADMAKIEKFLLKQKEISSVATFIGGPALRFILNYLPEDDNNSYGQFIISVYDYKDIKKLKPRIDKFIQNNFPHSQICTKLFEKGVTPDAKIEARFRGPNPTILRQLSEKAKRIMKENPHAADIKDDWRQRVKVIRPVFSEAEARKAGITRPDMIQAIKQAFNGINVGLYREDNNLLPIISRNPNIDRESIDVLSNIQIWSNIYNKPVNLSQLVTNTNNDWEDPILRRRYRMLNITAQCNTRDCEASLLFKQLKPKIEAIKLPVGYSLEWGGEYEKSRDAKQSLMRILPMIFLLMVIIALFLFNAIRQTLIIILCLPLSIIGVTGGLFFLGVPFNFMALLGFLSLLGMQIQNVIVLIDQIDREIKEGKQKYSTVVDASVNRLRPVLMTAVTTVLGLLPLSFDILYKSMAVTIMFGLGFATILTLIVVPVLYTLFFRITPPIDNKK
jgi:multidrug efflux pump subunit AcrB